MEPVEVICPVCGNPVADGEGHEVDGYTVCNACYRGYRYICSGCGTDVFDCYGSNREFMATHRETYIEGESFCPDCRDNLDTCRMCGCLVVNPQDGLCEDCYDDQHDCDDDDYGCGAYGMIRGYHTQNKTKKFFGKGKAFLGIELECERADGYVEDDDLMYIRDLFPPNALYFEEDCSLNRGVEIITAPMTYEYVKSAPFTDMLKYLRDNKYRSHNGGRCGMHIHVSREAFDSADSLVDAIYIVEKFWEEIVVLSRRGSRLNWSTPLGQKDKSLIDQYVKGSGYKERYSAVNLENSATVEFRFFRGTLLDESFGAAVDIIHAIVCIANMDDDTTDKYDTLADMLRGTGYMTDTIEAYMVSRGMHPEDNGDEQ